MPDDFQYVKLPDGSYGKFRSDATDEVIRSAISKDFPDAFKPKESPMAETLGKTTGISARSEPSQGPLIDTIEKAREWLQNKVTTGSQAGAGEFMASAPLGVLRVAKGGAELTNSPWQATKDVVGGGLQAATMPGMVIAPEAGEAAAGMIPSAARAGKKFEEVMGAARDIPIKAGGPVAEAMRGKEIASRGGQLPKILRDFVRRTSDVEGEPITYQEARDFYTNARLAMSEYLATKPNMWRQVTIFKNALGEALQDAANTAGKGSEYRSAMAEYRRAANLKKVLSAAAGLGISSLASSGVRKTISTLSDVAK
jgi:hypothetical protein